MEYRSKSDVVAEQLRALIHDGTLGPGAVLRQRDVAERFGVSPTPVREALRRLEAEGFVVTELHRGATVVRTEKARLRENFLVRASLESLAAGLAASKVTEDDLADLGRLHDAIAACPSGDPAVTDLNRRFHFRIYEAARSPIVTSLLNLLWRSLHGGPQVFRPHRQSVAQHRRILAALRAGDGDAAAELTRDHIMSAFELAERKLGDGGDRD